jgi:hypothetical protein
LGGVLEGLLEHLEGQALAAITEGGSGHRAELLGEGFAPGTQAIGSPGQGIGQGPTQSVIGVQALEDEIPEEDAQGEGPLVEAPGGQIEPGGQPLGREDLTEATQQLFWGEAGA